MLDRELRVAHADDRVAVAARDFDTPLQGTVSLIDDGEWSPRAPNVARVRAKISPAPLERRRPPSPR